MAIAVAIFSLLCTTFIPTSLPQFEPPVTIVGTLEGTAIEPCIILTHRGGKALDVGTKIVLTIGENVIESIAGDLLDPIDKEDGLWNIGERAIYTPDNSIPGSRVEVIVFDPVSNAVLMNGVLQE